MRDLWPFMLGAPPEKTAGVSWFGVRCNAEYIGNAQLRWLQVKRSNQRTAISTCACMHDAAQPAPDQHVALTDHFCAWIDVADHDNMFSTVKSVTGA